MRHILEDPAEMAQDHRRREGATTPLPKEPGMVYGITTH